MVEFRWKTGSYHGKRFSKIGDWSLHGRNVEGERGMEMSPFALRSLRNALDTLLFPNR